MRSEALTTQMVLRIIVGYVFLLEGSLKFILHDSRALYFETLGLPFPAITLLLVGIVEIVCGSLVLFNLQVRKAVIPLIIIMVMAIVLTKLPILLDSGLFSFAHESKLDIILAVLMILLFKSRKE